MKTSSMNPKIKKSPVVLALFPHARGLAHAVMDSPTNIVESGLKSSIPLCTRTCLKTAYTYLDYYQPNVVILEEITDKTKKARGRTLKLIHAIKEIAQQKKLHCAQYTRQDIMEAFEEFDAFTKHEINGVIAMCFPEYADKRPKKRGLGDPEPYRTGEFNAISLACTHLFKIS